MFFELTGERWIGDVMPVNEPVGAVVYSMDTSNVDSVQIPTKSPADSEMMSPGDTR